MPAVLGIDAGGIGTKVAAVDEATLQRLGTGTFDSLASEPLSNWMPNLRRWAEAIECPLREVSKIGIAIAVPIVHGKVHEKTGKFSSLKGRNIDEIAGELSRECGGLPVAILHDGAAALLGELAAVDDQHIPRSAGILTFGASIGFGYAWFGEVLVQPYTSWVSHAQLKPDFPGPFCRACQQRGCWRKVYQAYRDQEDHRALVEVIAQGTAIVVNTLPLDRLFLGGGRISTGGPELFDQICCELQPRLLIEPRAVLQPASADKYAGAIGAAFYARRNTI